MEQIQSRRVLRNLLVLGAAGLFCIAGFAIPRIASTQAASDASIGTNSPSTPSRSTRGKRSAPSVSSLGTTFPGTLLFTRGSYFQPNIDRVTDIGGNNDLSTIAYLGDDGPVFSRDGNKVLFRSRRDGELFTPVLYLYSMNADGTDQTRLTESPGFSVSYSYSPDAAKVVYTKDGDVWQINADGTANTEILDLTEPISAPRYTPDGTKIVFIYESKIWTMDPDGSNSAEIGMAGYADQFDLSPDGSTIAFSSNSEIFTIGLNGTNEVKIIDDDIVDYFLSDPKFSPDGAKLLMSCQGIFQFQWDNICTANTDGSAFAPLQGSSTERSSGTWSPDGSSIAFVSRNSPTNAYSVEAAVLGQAPVSIRTAENGDEIRSLAWQPDCTLLGGPTPTPTPTATPTPLSGIISEWNANLGNADDSVGTNHGQFLDNSGLMTPGKVGFGFNFPGNGGYVSVPDDDSLDVQAGDYTLSTWFFPYDSATHYVAGKGACGGTSSNFYIGVDPNYVPFIDISHEGGGSRVSDGSVVLSTFAWHHLLLRKQGPNHQLFVDGVLKINHDENNTIAANTAPFTIGKGDGCTTPDLTSNGAVDEVRLYGRGLTATEIDDIYNGSSLSRRSLGTNCVPHADPVIRMQVNYPHPIAAGRTGSVEIRTKTAAPAGGTVINLAYPNSEVVSGPSSVTIPEFQDHAQFNITTALSSAFASGDIIATLGSDSSRVTVTVAPAAPEITASNLTAPSPVSILQNFTASWRVTNSGQAPTNDYRQDTLYISTDDILFNSPNDVIVGRKYENGAAIAPGTFRDVTFDQVNIPASAIPVDGTYYLFVYAGDAGTVNERNGNWGDNSIGIPITVNRNLPDLIVQNIAAPTEVEPRNTFTISWEAKNQGSAATLSGSRQDIFYSFDQTAGNADDVLMTQRFDPIMAIGEVRSYSQQYFFNTLPVRPSSDGMFFVKIDAANQVYEDAPGGAAETNNVTTFASRFEYRVPDLQVAVVSPPAEVESDTEFALNWTTQNAGNKLSPGVMDLVYFSTDNIVSGNDTLIGTFPLSQTLDPGQSVARTQNVNIPTNAIPSTGNYFVYVVTDAYAQVDEGANENNNTTFSPLRVRRLLRPDLQVTNITGPSTVFFDQQIQVQWTVSNNGAGPTNAANWQDDLYLGVNQSLVGAVRLATLSNISFLNTGESYIATATVRIPRGSSGSYYLIVKTDKDGLVNEENENNNLTTRPITVNIPPLPDVRVSNVQAPETGVGGQPISVSWTVTNHGDGATPANESTWSDAIYISRDAVFSGDDRFIGARERSGVLQPNGSYTVSGHSVNLPGDAFGDYYVFVVADAYDQLYEFTANGNNSNYDATAPGSPMHVLGTPPDLTVLNPITAPASELAGRQINVQFTVRNQGAFDANGGWYDTVYLSTDPNFDPVTDTPIGSLVRSGLAAGGQYGINMSVTLPNCLDGTYYLFAVTDAYGQIFEYDAGGNAESNNISQPKQIQISSFAPDLRVTNITVPPVVVNGAMPIAWTVKNFGTAATLQTIWTDRIYLIYNGSVTNLGSFDRSGGLAVGAEYTQNRIVYIPLFLEGDMQIIVQADAYNNVPECSYETNNEISAATSVQQDLPDLRATGVGAPGTAALGQTFSVSWTGGNYSAAMTGTTSWADTVYLSSDNVLTYGDIPIGGAVKTAQLGSGQTYSGSTDVTIPGVMPGNYFLFVNADNGNHVVEGVNETNNASAPIPITITAPQVDLQVTNVAANPLIYSGQFADVSWTVTNLGSTPTVTGNWTDYLVLSRDSVYDSTDRVIDFVNREAPLAGGASYTVNRSVAIPSGLTGEYKIFVIADRNNAVVESVETNNISSPLTVELQLPPPAELNITNISVPATAILGENAAFQWTVQNSSANGINAVWQDSVYLSTDQVWDSGDALIGQVQRSGVLGAYATYTGTLDGPMPPVETGTYYVIVRADARNNIRESNEANNVTSSISSTTINIANLTLGVALNTSLVTAQERYYSILNTPADETMLITLDGEEGSRNELYSRSGAMVTRANFEFQDERGGRADQENVIRNTSSGTYYTMIRGDYVPGSFAQELKRADDIKNKASLSPQNVTIKAEILPFTIRNISPAVAGNSGLTTVVVEGAKFKPGATIRLVGQNNTELAPVDGDNSSTRFAAMFDLKGKAAGDYDVVVRNPDNQTATLANGFKIVSGGGYSLRSGLVGESEVRPGTTRYIFSASNDGLNDALNVPILISFPANYNFRIDPRNLGQFPQSELPPGTPANGVPLFLDVNGIRTLMLYAPILRSGATIEVGVDLDIPLGFGGFKVAVQVMPPLAEFVAGTIPNQPARPTVPYGPVSLTPGSDPQQDCWTEVARQAIFIILGELLPGECLGAGWNVLLSSADAVTSLMLKGGGASGFDVVNSLAGKVMSSLGNLAVECGGQAIPWFKAASAAVAIFQLVMQIVDCLQNLHTELRVTGRRSIDPNEKIGPTGFGPERWVAKDKPLLYRINFENLPTATAPAQRVQIIDQLPSTLDPRTVRLLEIGFKQYRVEVPANRAFYQSRLQLGDDLNNLKADISAGLDITTGRVTWTLTAIDPQTNERPLSPLLGILPPNNADRDGEGYVIFSAAPAPGVPNRTDIANTAKIYFDENEPIVTNATTNLVDADVPTSQVAALPATASDPAIQINWAGGDDPNGSGLKGFDVLASENGGTFLPFIAGSDQTNGVFNGKWGRTYRFYSVASDNAGNIEAPPGVPDATIRVLGSSFESDVAAYPSGDNDGVVNDQDVAQVRRFTAKLDQGYQFNDFQAADSAPRADGGNGSLTVGDVIQTKRYAMGLDLLRDYTGPLSAGTLSGKAIRGRSDGLLPRGIYPFTLSRVGNKLTVAIALDAQGDETGIGFTLNYNTGDLTNPQNITLGDDAAGAVLTTNTSQPGKVGVVIDKLPTQPFAAGGRVIAKIEFDVISANGTTLLSFGGDPVANEVVNGDALALTSTSNDTVITILGPTAASVSVSGRVVTAGGRPIANTVIFLSDDSGVKRRAITNGFGRYQFDGVESGRSYVISARHKTFQFVRPSYVVQVDDAVENADFTALE